GCDGAGLDNLQQRGFDGVIDPQATEGNAARLAVVEQTTVAGIARDVVSRAAVADCQFTAAPAAAVKTGKQGIAVFGRPMMAARRDVLAHHPADRLRTLPVEITFVRAGLQRQPFLARLAAATGANVRASVSRHRSGFTIGIGAAVDRVCHHPVDRRVAWPSPNDLPVAAPGWQIQTVL